MADTFTKRERSGIMRKVRSRGNKATELILVRILRDSGMTGWRRHPPIPGRPDFIFPKQRLALFVDGCFWHGCKKHCRMPASNQKYWNAKIERNSRRDRKNRAALRARGWKVVGIWEHELKTDQARVVRKISKALDESAGRAGILKQHG